MLTKSVLDGVDKVLKAVSFDFDAVAHYEPSYSGPSCSKLTVSLVNESLKFTSSDTQIC